MEKMTKNINKIDESIILDTIYDLREAFEASIDKSWFYVVIDDLPIELKTIKTVKDFVYTQSAEIFDIYNIYSGIIELESFINHVKKYLLPVIREKLRISYLHPGQVTKDRDQYVLRSLIAYALPMNLKRLEQLAKKLKIHVCKVLELYN